ncbi:MAG TPA: sialidase family protein, partial [Gemmatimonadales bacterium]|nr:sialidase family protein [Gemmatimonadales bacterium]
MKVTPLEIPSAGGSQSADPALAVAPSSGDLVLGWVEGNGTTWSLYTARSNDGGGQWSAPVKVAGGSEAPEEVHPHGESSPRLVAGPGDRVAFVWPNSIKVPGRKWPAAMLRFARSEDGGVRWSKPITLNDDTTGALVSHQFHGAIWVGDSGIAVAWMDEREAAAPITSGTDGHAEHAAEPDATIYMTVSSDFGRSWGPNRIGWKAACPCCRISLARTADGQAIAAWRKHFPGNVRDVVTAVVGTEVTEPERVHPDDWAYAGCPHTGPAIATGGDGS